jgi:glycosyltransferase involved in cell wall biosynthesis
VTIRPIRIALRRWTVRQTPGWKLLRYLEFVSRSFFHLLFSRARIIVAHDLSALPPAWLAARLSGARIVYHAHELYGETNEVTAPMQTIWRGLDRFFCPRVDALIAPEPNRARIYREEYGATSEPLVIPNYPMYREPVASARLRDVLRERGIEPSGILLYQGLFDEGRCLHRIIEAMPMTPEGIVLVMIGRGFAAYTEHLLRRITELGLERRVVLLPFVPYRDLHAWSCSADAGILLYRNDCRNNYYCAPNKLYEYFQAGLPVITSDFPGLVPIVRRDALGVCVDPESPDAIAAGIASVFADGNREQTRARALSMARDRYRWDLCFPLISGLYSSLEG